jgi:hypothetical protein
VRDRYELGAHAHRPKPEPDWLVSTHPELVADAARRARLWPERGHFRARRIVQPMDDMLLDTNAGDRKSIHVRVEQREPIVSATVGGRRIDVMVEDWSPEQPDAAEMLARWMRLAIDRAMYDRENRNRPLWDAMSLLLPSNFAWEDTLDIDDEHIIFWVWRASAGRLVASPKVQVMLKSVPGGVLAHDFRSAITRAVDEVLAFERKAGRLRLHGGTVWRVDAVPAIRKPIRKLQDRPAAAVTSFPRRTSHRGRKVLVRFPLRDRCSDGVSWPPERKGWGFESLQGHFAARARPCYGIRSSTSARSGPPHSAVPPTRFHSSTTR